MAEEPIPLATYSVVQQVADRAVKIRYGSTSGIDGSPTTVSGVLFVPKGTAPQGGWPIASIGHPTVGLDSECAPSSYPGLMGNAGTIAQFLTFGYVVVMTDYQGLGTPGPHPYLDPTTEANDVIDAVRAARAVVPETSDTWVGYGVSQGGQAVWAANEEAAEYGRGLRLVGTMSIAPATDLRPLVDAMQAGTLTVEQKVLVPMVLKGLQVRHPELDLDDYLHGVMARSVDAFIGCEGENSSQRGIIAQGAPASDFMPSSPQAADRLRQWFGADVLPRRPASAPMLVGYGDADPIVLPQWTATAVARACALGDVIDAHVAPGQGHGTLDLGSALFDWVSGRVAGTPPPNTCPPA
ncbi:putative lipase [Mycolicibacterium madagascariense]|uniref:Putative lipase n=1 Tax=Mycolicibacterium madagascariense TaxID=212765 RepID=A0A7I7XES4_9MYCO|nr:putative lipase [Mycolicibacterium madagascariense]